MRERGVAVLGRAGRQLLDRARRRAPRDPPACGGATRTRRRAGSYGSETVTSVARGERLEQPPLRPGQILEPVREHRPAVPGVQLGAQPLDRAAAEQVAVPEPEPVELGPVGRVEQREIAVELLRDRAAPTRARRAPRAASRRSRRSAPSGRGRSAACPRAPAARRARAGRRSRPAVRPDRRARARGRRRRTSRSSRPSSAPLRASRSRSIRSTSDRFGTIRTGSRSIASRYPSSSRATLPAFAGPTTSANPIDPS